MSQNRPAYLPALCAPVGGVETVPRVHKLIVFQLWLKCSDWLRCFVVALKTAFVCLQEKKGKRGFQKGKSLAVPSNP